MSTANGTSGVQNDDQTATPQKDTSETVDIQNSNGDTTNINDVSDDAEIVVPPDGGWGWVVIIASFMCNMIVDGIIFSFGIFLEDIAQDLDTSKSQVSLVGSLMSGFYLLAGPFTSALANRYGFRLVAIIGSIVGASAFGLSYLANSVQFLWGSYGFLGGIGFGLIYVPAVITVGFYFERWRALATGIAVCGSGIGGFLFAPLCQYLKDAYGWRNSLLIQAGIVLSCIIFSLAFRPVKPTKLKFLKQKKDAVLETDIQKLPETTRLKMEKVLENLKTGSMSAVNNNSDYPTVADVYHTICAPQYSAIVQEKRLSVPFINKEDKLRQKGLGAAGQPLLGENATASPVIVSHRRHTMSRVRTTSENSYTKSKTDINRPLYREDIFFSGSLARLPQYQSRTSVGYNLSVTHIATQNDIDEEAENRCTLCPEAVKRTLATMLDFSLLKSPTFNILAISGTLIMLGFYVPFVYVKDRATNEYKMSDNVAIYLLSAIGIANTIGRVLCGVITSLPGVNTLLVNNIAISLGGLATLASGLSSGTGYQFTYAVVFGLSISCFASLRSILVVDLLGLEKLTNAFGLLLLFQGVGAAIGSPLAGAFMEATGSYDYSFYLSGSLILISAILCFPLNAINKWEMKRNQKISSPI